MRKIVIILHILVVFINTSLSAQITTEGKNTRNNPIIKLPPVESVDVSIIECLYQYIVTDSILDKFREHTEILQIGRNISKSFDYNEFLQDSIFLSIGWNNVHENTADSVNAQHWVTRRQWTFKNKIKSETETQDRIFGDCYSYNEPMISQDWQIHEDTDTICGYLCQKATTCFRGRHWTAWFCNLPIDDGPWKFHGLPGLILQIEDKSRHHVFKAISVRKGGNSITKYNDGYPIKTNRKAFNKALSSYKENPLGVLSNTLGLTPTVTDAYGAPAEATGRLFYNNIEME